MSEFHPNQFQSTEELIQGAVLVIDKPLDWTSFDVVNRIKGHARRHLGAPKFKIGHAGTLDPLASGVLVVCTGKFTKSIHQLQGGEKEYTGTIRFGQVTPSYDLETAPEGSFPMEHLTEDLLRAAAAGFTGEILQTPPHFSAKWINGERAYESARRGEEVAMRAVPVTVHSFELTRIALPEVDFRIRCSKGTYIRSLAHDLGKAAGSGSYLASLRRTASFPFTVADSDTLDAILARMAGLSPIPRQESPAR